MTDDYTFQVDLAVVESLGINLYSNAAAVLSELVANAWDADANEVKIDWDTDNDRITITDDGRGMTKDEMNGRYLTVAYKKRDEEGVKSPKFDRPYMGRKGIGKLSVFSLANEVRVYSSKGGESHGFCILLSDLRACIAERKTYHPKPEPVPSDFTGQGTRIVLNDLNRKRAGVSVLALRRRVARRFDTLAFKDDDENRFFITIDGKRVSYQDREDLKRLEYIWQFGDDDIKVEQTPNVKHSWIIRNNVVDEAKGWALRGWFGTVKTPDQLNDEQDEQESLRNIIILARKRPIQEGILDQLDFNKIFANYVTGQISAEFLDIDDGEDDIATSDRQRLIEDDYRVRLLTTKLRESFNTAASEWSAERPKQKFKELTDKYPEVREWVNTRNSGHRKAATQLISTIAALPLEEEKERRSLYKSGILAFERMAIESSTQDLERFAEGIFAIDMLPLLAKSTAYEDALYLQILRNRLSAIETLGKMINKDELEKVLQKHLFDNMWLLDPSWEGATGDVDMEISLSRVRGKLFDKTEATNKAQGRIDLQYRSSAGVHMIVELKKYERRTTLDELFKQGAKYHKAMREVLDKQGHASRLISVVFVLGQKPSIEYAGNLSDEDAIANRLETINGRVLYYDELLSTAQRRYKEYRDKRTEITDLDRILATLDDDPDPAAESESDALV